MTGAEGRGRISPAHRARGAVSRRAFLAATAAAAGAGLLPGRMRAAWPGQEPGAGPLPLIALGRTGRTVPRLGFGGFPISRLEEAGAVRVVRRAIELGVRYLDTAPSYGAGSSERSIGRAIAESGLERGAFFVATKTLRRDGPGARRELEESLERLGLDQVDSISAHEVHDDVESLFGPGAVLAALRKAKDEGLTRHIGITGHRNPKYLVAAVERFEFDTALVPVNPLDRRHLSFIEDFAPVAARRGVAVVAMKVYGGGSLVGGGRLEAGELLRYALSQPHVAVVVPGCESVEHVEDAVEAVRGFEPLTADAQRDLEARAGPHLGRRSEWYKEE